MRRWNLVKLLSSFALGALVASFYFKLRESPVRIESGAPTTQAMDGFHPHRELTIAEESDDVELGQTDVASGPSEPGASGSKGDAEIQDFHSFLADARVQSRAKAAQREIDLLTEAGFTPERIEWIRSRVEQLRADRERGTPDTDPYMSAAYVLDKDLDLVGEIGEEEYDNYRQALGRPRGVRIDEVPDSALQGYGLQAGDVIVRVNDTRTYNRFIFGKAVRGSGPEGSVVMEVERNGQEFSVAVPRDRLANLHTEATGAARLRTLGPPPMILP